MSTAVNQKRTKLVWVIVTIGFLFTYYLGEFSPWGIKGVSLYNGGYGTFDMQMYPADEVAVILDQTEPEGFGALYLYYALDYIFIVFCNLFQGMVIVWIYRSFKKNSFWKNVSNVAIAATIVKAAADFLENTLLLIAIVQYPKDINLCSTLASATTKVKFYSAYLGIFLLLVGAAVWISCLLQRKK